MYCQEILPAITQQHEVQRALKLQIENLEDQRAVLDIEKKGMSKEYKGLKYFGEKKLSEYVTTLNLIKYYCKLLLCFRTQKIKKTLISLQVEMKSDRKVGFSMCKLHPNA